MQKTQSVPPVLSIRSRIKGRSRKPAPTRWTLLDLVWAVHAVADSDREIVAAVVHMVNKGQVQLCGTFAGAKICIPPTPST